MTWHTYTQALIGWLSPYPLLGFGVAAIGAILLIWSICKRPLGPKPQPKEAILDPAIQADLIRALQEDHEQRRARIADDIQNGARLSRTRNANGRFAKNPLTKPRKRVSAKRPGSCSG